MSFATILMSDLLLFVGILALLILGHEFGHFVAARLQGVKVTEFGIGFPPRLLTLFHAGGTRFTVNAIPLGGFVRPAGEDDPSVPGGWPARPNERGRSCYWPALRISCWACWPSPLATGMPPLTQRVIDAGRAGSGGGAGLQRATASSVSTICRSMDSRLLRDATAATSTLVSLTVLRQKETISVPITPRSEHPPDEGPLGITIGHPTLQTSWGQATVYGLDSVALQVENLVLLPSRLVRGEVAPDQARVSGLKGMYDMFAWAGEIDRGAQRPFLTLNLVGLISIGLALANVAHSALMDVTLP
jgi:regulator of sigma E protease